jgi:DNA-binding response OmpR family regulator
VTLNLLFESLNMSRFLISLTIFVAPQSMQHGKKKILLIESDPDMLFILENALVNSRYLVESHTSGSSVIESKFDLPDLFIVDKDLPTLDGIAVCKYLRLKEVTRGIPIIMLSIDEIKNKVIEIGVDEFVRKPFDLGQLLEIVDRKIHISIWKDVKSF